MSKYNNSGYLVHHFLATASFWYATPVPFFTHSPDQGIVNTFSHRSLALDDGDASIFSTNGQVIRMRTIKLLLAAPLTHLVCFEHTIGDVERAFGSYRFFSANGMCHLRVDGTRFP